MANKETKVSKTQIDWNAVLLRLTSRKFLLAFICLVVILLAAFVPSLNIPDNIVVGAWFVVGGYIGIEGIKDIRNQD